MSNKKHTEWLKQQFPYWLQQGWIQPGQVEHILAHYQGQQHSRGRMIFSALGAMLFGLGIILFFAYNWQGMHRLFKLLVIFSFLIGAHVASWWFARAPRHHAAASEGLALLGTVLFGAAIWLISQIYHIDEHMPNAFWLWGAAAMAMAWARLSALQCLAGIGLLFIWGCLEIFHYSIWFHSAPWWLLLSAASLAWVLRSAGLLFLSVVAFYFLWVMSMLKPLDDAAGFLVLAISVFLVQLGFITARLQDRLPWNFRHALAVPGFAAYMILVFVMTFVHHVSEKEILKVFDDPFQTRVFWCSLTVAVLMPLLSLWPARQLGPRSETDALHSLLMLLTVGLAFSVGSGGFDLSYGVFSGVMNLLFLGHCLLFILHGSQQQRGWEVAAGCLLFAMLVFARYTDLFDSLLSRSLVFLILGACLFAVGNFYARQKQERQP